MPIKQTVPTNSGDYLQFGNATTPVAAQVGGYEDSTGNGHLELYTTASGTVTERVRVTSAGNVGIGTASPAYKLDVNGNLNVASSTTLASSNWVSFGTDNTFYSDSSYGLVIKAPATSNFIAFRSSNDTERMRIDSSGNVAIGTTTIGQPVQGYSFYNAAGAYQGIGHASGVAGGQPWLVFGYNGTSIGSITQSGTTGTLYNITSDQRLKENIVDAPSALAKIDSVKVRSFDFKSDGSHVDFGTIAQELYEIAPECVAKGDDGEEIETAWAVDTSVLVPAMIKAIQELSAKVTALEAQLGAK